jgi:uncharacterized membrane protein YphA (DoxX/SURF4 family)
MIPQLQREAPVAPPDSVAHWSLATRLAFRFLFAYFIFYIYPRPVGSLGSGVKYSNPVRDMWHAVVPWVGANILHISGNFTEVANGSGDQLYDYVQLVCIAMTAAIVTVIWSWMDRKRPNYTTLYQWLRLFMRMTVAVAMISYGANKLFRMQFPEPGLPRLVDTFGQSSPMGLLWSFMGMSRAYSFFGGVGEMLGGLLLLVPRFTVIGSLVTLGVMSNVLMLNLAYDVPRKIYSIHLVLCCLFLLLPDFWKLMDFFLLNRKVKLTSPISFFKDKQLNYGVVILQLLIGIAAIIVFSNQAYKDAVKAATYQKPPLHGIWTVEEFSIDDSLRPPLTTDNERWRRVIFDTPSWMTVQSMDDSLKNYYLQIDDDKKTFTLWDVDHPHWKGVLVFADPESDHMTMQGNLGARSLSVKLNRVNLSDPSKFLLTNRGFHWINPFVQNR